MGDVACHFVLVAFCVHRYIRFFNVSAFVFYFPVDAVFRRCATCRLANQYNAPPPDDRVSQYRIGQTVLAPTRNWGPVSQYRNRGNRGVLTTRTHTLAVAGSPCALLSPHTHTYYFTLCLLRSTSHSPRPPPRPFHPDLPPFVKPQQVPSSLRPRLHRPPRE